MDREVIFEGLSALLGVTVRPLPDTDRREKTFFSKVQGTVQGAGYSTVPALLTVGNFLPTIWFQSTRYTTLDHARFGQTQTETGKRWDSLHFLTWTHAHACTHTLCFHVHQQCLQIDSCWRYSCSHSLKRIFQLKQVERYKLNNLDIITLTKSFA